MDAEVADVLFERSRLGQANIESPANADPGTSAGVAARPWSHTSVGT